MAEDIETKLEKLNKSIASLAAQKSKYLSKISMLDEKIEHQQMKLKDIKSATLIDTCEQKELTIKDIQVLSKGIADGTVLEYLGIKKQSLKEEKNDEE